MKNKVLVLIGLPASGKTTFAKNWINKSPETRVRFNRDDIRNMLGKYWMPERESVINDMFISFMESAMGQGYDIVIDNMNLNPYAIKEIKNIVNNFNNWENNLLQYEIEFVKFTDVELETCIKRDSERDNSIGEEVIRSIYNKYKYLLDENV